MNQLISYTVLTTFSLITIVTTYSTRFKDNVLSFPYLFFTLLFLLIPMAFHVSLGDKYSIGEGLGICVNINHSTVFLGQLYLLFTWFVGAGSLAFLTTKKLNQFNSIYRGESDRIRIGAIYFVALVVFYLTYVDGLAFKDAQINVIAKKETLLVFLFFDHAFLIIAGMYGGLILNLLHEIPTKKVMRYVAFIFLSFVLLGTLNGSKAAILTTLSLFVLYPLYVFRQQSGFYLVFFNKKSLISIALISLFMFYVVLLKRTSHGSLSMLDILSNMNNNIDYVGTIFSDILYRFSWGGYDRYLILFDSFVMSDQSDYGITEYLPYIAKNFINLVLPGTPFAEAYAPSSQIYSSVVQYEVLDNLYGRDNLITKLNSQPYTIFGVLMILAGIYAPIFLFLWFVFLSLIYRFFNNILIKAGVIYLFLGALSSFGIEVVFANSMHLMVSIAFMSFVIHTLRHRKKRVPLHAVK